MSKRSAFPKRKLILVALDLAIIIFCYAISVFFLNITPPHLLRIISELFLVILIYQLALNTLRVYQDIISFEGLRDYIKYFIACFISAALLAIISRIFHFQYIGLRVNALAGMLSAILMVSYRLVRKTRILSIHRFNRNQARGAQNVLIIGAGYGAREIINTVKVSMKSKYNIIGIVDDDLTKINHYISGVKILGTRDNITQLVDTYNVDVIFFAIHNINPVERSKILEICQNTNVKVRTLPTTKDIISRQGALTSLRDVQIEDLLSRKPITLSNNGIRSYVRDKVVLVAGGGGSIGSELCRQLITYRPKTLIIVDIYENNLYDIQQELVRDYTKADIVALVASIRDKARMENIFSTYRPDIVFHAAAHKHVPLMEVSPLEAIKNNVFGTYNIVECAHKFLVEKFILISSDKAVNPTNVMGATKRVCEMIVQSKNKKSKTEYVAVRFGNVLGSNGSVVPLFRKQIAAGGPVTVSHKDIIRYFMTIPEAVQLILQATSYAKGGEVFVLDMGKPVRIYDLAIKMIKMMGLEPNVDIPIKITGLRPGEKLYEELLTADENLEKTKHEQIFIVSPGCPSEKELKQNLANLEKLLKRESDNLKIVRRALKNMVPTFKEPEEINKKEKQQC